MSTPLNKTEYELLATFRYTLRKFLRFSEEAARTLGLEPQQHQALLAVKGFPGRERITIGELAERLQIRHHSAVGLINRLVDLDLLVREGSADRRQVYIALTLHGETVLEQLTTVHKAELARLGPELQRVLNQLGQITTTT